MSIYTKVLLLLSLGCFCHHLNAQERYSPTRPGQSPSVTRTAISQPQFYGGSDGQATLLKVPDVSFTDDGRVYLGIDVLERARFAPIAGKRVGLLTHPAGVNRDGVSTIEVLRRAPEVKLVALFGPEHGIYGDEKAEIAIPDRKDERTGLPVFSLYGKTRRPTPQMLDLIDVLVVDLQDLGVRSYTYVSAMRYAMEECFRHNKQIVVLDRPNPLGGLKVDGPLLDKEWMSYVGAFRVPYVHGLTIGELARMAKEIPGWMPDITEEQQRRGNLLVVPMHGWKRSDMWTDTRLRWMPTSPAIPDLSAAMGYSMTGLGAQIGGFKHGYGTRLPFRLLQFSGKSPEEIAEAMKRCQIDGLDFRVVHWTEADGKSYRGCHVVVTDWRRLKPTEVSFHMMALACLWAKNGENPFANASKNSADLFNKHVGSTAFWSELVRQGELTDIKKWSAEWELRAKNWQAQARRYWLYR